MAKRWEGSSAMTSDASYHRRIMHPDVERLFEEAMALSEDERVMLIAILGASLRNGSSQAEIDAAWAAEIESRLAAVRSGEVELIPTEEVERELEEIVEQAEGSRRVLR